MLDETTGLTWQQAPPMNPCPSDSQGNCTWADAKTYCENLTLGGFSSGWTLPDVNQLFSLVSIVDGGTESFDTGVFAVPPNDTVWSSTPAEGGDFSPDTAWAINFFDGIPGNYGEGDALGVRCVR